MLLMPLSVVLVIISAMKGTFGMPINIKLFLEVNGFS